MFVSDKRYFLTADDRVVEENDPAAHRLLVGIGGSLPDAQARKYGLVVDEAAAPEQPAAPPVVKAVTAAPANKAVKGPEANK